MRFTRIASIGVPALLIGIAPLPLSIRREKKTNILMATPCLPSSRLS